jgi:hypothetical protein
MENEQHEKPTELIEIEFIAKEDVKNELTYQYACRKCNDCGMENNEKSAFSTIRIFVDGQEIEQVDFIPVEKIDNHNMGRMKRWKKQCKQYLMRLRNYLAN